MKNSKMKIVSVFLIVCMILINIPKVQANGSDINSSNIYVNEEENYILERVIDKTKVTVFVKSLNGDIQNVVVNDNGNIYLDGELLQEETNNNSLLNPGSLVDARQPSTYASNKWGKWNTSITKSYKTGGKNAALIAAIIAGAAPMA